MHKFFGGVAAQYHQFRPDYPVELLQAILQRCQHHHLYIDLACGTGQLTKQLAPSFQHSIGIDKAAGSIEEARKQHPQQITWIEGDASTLSPSTTTSTLVGANSVSLITIAQALHWFLPPPPTTTTSSSGDDDNKDGLWQICDQVLQSQGVLAIISYAVIQPRDPILLHHFNTFYYHHLGSHLPPDDPKCCWGCDRRLVDSGYEGVTFPYASSAKKESFLIHHSLSKESFFGYLRTYSALPAFYQKQSEVEAEKRVDPLKELEAVVGDREVVEVDLRYWLLTFVKP